MDHKIATAYFLSGLLFLTGCGNDPKEIPAEEGGSEGASTGVFSGGEARAPQGALDPAAEKDLHTVVALEALPTAKYVYVRVKEGDKEYWIATILQDVAIGHSYFYRGGLLKTAFESKEYKRIFDKLFLVSQLVPAEHGSGMSGSAPTPQAPVVRDAPLPALDVQGITRIRDVLADPKRFDGKTVQVSGTCTKVNPNIMGRNWIHVKEAGDASKELVITTNEAVAEGQQVTVIGKVAVDKDFGAGYRYDVLLEEGRLAPPS